MTKAQSIVKAIMADFTDRRGLRQEWEQIDKGIQNEIVQKWEEIVAKELNGVDMTAEEKTWPSVAMLAGKSEVIEAIVQSANKEYGLKMNWGYIAGRAIIYSKDDRVKCRSALGLTIPVSDIEKDEHFAMYCKKEGEQ